MIGDLGQATLDSGTCPSICNVSMRRRMYRIWPHCYDHFVPSCSIRKNQNLSSIRGFSLVFIAVITSAFEATIYVTTRNLIANRQDRGRFPSSRGTCSTTARPTSIRSIELTAISIPMGCASISSIVRVLMLCSRSMIS